MWHRLRSNRLLAPLGYVAMSLLVVWHTIAMVVAAAPESDITAAARSLLDRYLILLRLENNWGFFAPTVDPGSQLRVVVEDAAGNRQTFTPDQGLNRYHPTSLWFRDFYTNVMEEPMTYADRAGTVFCREHAALKPVSVTFLAAEQSAFGPADRAGGKHPLDPEFITVRTLKTVPCSTP